MNTPQTLGERLALLRGVITQSEFAETIGISQNSLCRYERNQRMPKASIINQVCKVTGASYEWLISGQGEMYAPETPHRLPLQQTALPTSVASECPRCTELEYELKQEREERREFAAETRRLYREKEELHREKEQLLREKEDLLRENGILREKLAGLEAERDKRRSEHEEGDFPSIFDENHTTSSSRPAIIRK